MLGTIAGVEIAGFQSVMLIQMPEIGVLTPSVVIGMLAAWPCRRLAAHATRPVDPSGRGAQQ